MPTSDAIAGKVEGERAQPDLRALFDELKERALKASWPRKTVVVNLYGGPGPGKTAAALEVAEKLREAGYAVEYVSEHAKELARKMNSMEADPAQRSLAAVLLNGSFSSQRQVHGAQLQRIWRFAGQCDFVVTDSPLALSALYLKPKSATERESFDQMVARDLASFENFNVVVKRAGPRDHGRRTPDDAEATGADRAVTRFLDAHGIRYVTCDRAHLDIAARGAVRMHEQLAGRSRSGEGRNQAMEDRTTDARQDGAWVYMSVPKTSYKDKDSVRVLTVAGKPMVQVTLPPHVPPVQTADGPLDVAFFTMLVPPQAVKAWPNDPNYYDVSFPAANRDGEPWMVGLQKSQGHWEDPDGRTREEKGTWVVDEPVKVRVQATALADSMQEYREGRLEYARARAVEEGREWTEPRRAALQEATDREAVPDTPASVPVASPVPARTQASSPASTRARTASPANDVTAAARSASLQATRSQPVQQERARQGAIA